VKYEKDYSKKTVRYKTFYAGTSSSAGRWLKNFSNPECPAETLAPGF